MPDRQAINQDFCTQIHILCRTFSVKMCIYSKKSLIFAPFFTNEEHFYKLITYFYEADYRIS